MMEWSDRGNKVFWFRETEAGNQKLVRPDGTSRLFKRRNPMFETSVQCHAGWQRAMLFMEEYGIWDATAFACSMDTMIGIRYFDQAEGRDVVYLFATCQHAERGVYPFLNEAAVQQCRKNVDDFYADPNLQAAWSSYILYPVCLKVTEGSREFEPVGLAEIGDGEQVLNGCQWDPVPSLAEWEMIEELFERQVCYNKTTSY